VKNTG